MDDTSRILKEREGERGRDEPKWENIPLFHLLKKSLTSSLTCFDESLWVFFFGVLSSYMRCMYYSLRAPVCDAFTHTHARKHTRIHTGTHRYHFLTRMCVGGMRNCVLCTHVCACVWRTFLRACRHWRAWIFHSASSSSTKSPGFCVLPSSRLPLFLLSRTSFTVLCSLSSRQVVTETETLLLQRMHVYQSVPCMCQCVSCIDHWRSTSTLAKTDDMSASNFNPRICTLTVYTHTHTYSHKCIVYILLCFTILLLALYHQCLSAVSFFSPALFAPPPLCLALVQL